MSTRRPLTAPSPICRSLSANRQRRIRCSHLCGRARRPAPHATVCLYGHNVSAVQLQFQVAWQTLRVAVDPADSDISLIVTINVAERPRTRHPHPVDTKFRSHCRTIGAHMPSPNVILVDVVRECQYRLTRDLHKAEMGRLITNASILPQLNDRALGCQYPRKAQRRIQRCATSDTPCEIDIELALFLSSNNTMDDALAATTTVLPRPLSKVVCPQLRALSAALHRCHHHRYRGKRHVHWVEAYKQPQHCFFEQTDLEVYSASQHDPRPT